MIEGDFKKALHQLILDVKESKLDCFEILSRWDNIRGNDWFTLTRKEEEGY